MSRNEPPESPVAWPGRLEAGRPGGETLAGLAGGGEAGGRRRNPPAYSLLPEKGVSRGRRQHAIGLKRDRIDLVDRIDNGVNEVNEVNEVPKKDPVPPTQAEEAGDRSREEKPSRTWLEAGRREAPGETLQPTAYFPRKGIPMREQAQTLLARLPMPATVSTPRGDFRPRMLDCLANLDFSELQCLCAFFSCAIDRLTTLAMNYVYGQARQLAAVERKKARAVKKAAKAVQAPAPAKADTTEPPAPNGALDAGIRCCLCGRTFGLCLSVTNLRKGRFVCPVAKMREAVRAHIQTGGIPPATAYLCWDCYNDVLEGDYPS